MGIQDLPNELLDSVMGQLAKMPPEDHYDSSSPGFDALRKARLVCHQWNRAASLHLFRTLHLQHQEPPEDAEEFPETDSQAERPIFQRWHDTVDLHIAKLTARHVIVDTVPPDFPESGLDRWEWNRTPGAKFEGFDDALARIAELPNLEAVEVHFSDQCVGVEGDDDIWKDECEHVAGRRNALQAVFRAIHNRKLKMGHGGGENPGSDITYLALKDVQNVADKEFENSDIFQSVIKDLQHLHLQVLTEYNQHGPDYDIYKLERVRFEPDLQAGLLSAVASHLTTLSLSFNEEWGTLPGYFDGSDLDFPRLQTLRLRTFAISHDNHLDWVLRMPALKSLYISETRIMTHARIEKEYMVPWNLQTHDWVRLGDGAYGFDPQKSIVFTYAGRWHHFFDRIRLGLKGLKDFRISWRDDERFEGIKAPWAWEQNALTEPELSTERYMVFDYGLLPSPWIYPWRYEGNMNFGDNNPDPDAPRESTYPYHSDNKSTENHGKMHEAEDEKALRKLLEATWARR